MSKPLISIIASSIRVDLWGKFYNSFSQNLNNVDIECVFVGPVSTNSELPYNFKHIKTENIKPSQCFEIGIRESQGDFIMIVGDDHIINTSLDKFYMEYNNLSEKRGNDKFFLLPLFKFGDVLTSAPYHRKITIPHKNISTLGALINKKWVNQIGGIDRRFIGVYYDIDFIMRFLQDGGEVIRTPSKELIIQEDQKSNDKRTRLTSKITSYDRSVVDSFWVRLKEGGEKVPSDKVYGYYRDRDYVLSKYRLKDFEPFEDKDIKLLSQGTTEHIQYGWV